MKDKDFQKSFVAAQNGDTKALEELITIFMPCMIKNSFINGNLDSDCLQEIILRFINCIHNFKFDVKGDISIFTDVDVYEYSNNEQ